MPRGVRTVRVSMGTAELAWAEHRARAEETTVSAVLTGALRLAREREQERNRQMRAWSNVMRAARAQR